MRLIGKLTPKRSLHGTISKTADVVGSNIQSIRIYENGTYEVSAGIDGFNPVYVNTPEPKEEQEKVVDITENGTTEVLPDEGSVLSKVTVNVDVAGGGGDWLQYVVEGGNGLFAKAKSFPSKAVVNLPNATTLYQAFAYWNNEPIPIVTELTVNAPNIDVSNDQYCMGQMFTFNNGIEKVVLNMPDECQYMSSTFQQTKKLVEVVLNFLTKNIISYRSAFNGSTIEIISGTLDFSSATNVNVMFNGCNNLKDVMFKPNTLSLSISLAQSSKLTSESIQSIIDGLATVTTAQTLTLHADVKAKLTQTQLDTISSKNWNLA